MKRIINIFARTIAAMSLLAIFAICTGCDTEDTSTHDLVVSWNIAGSQICEQLIPSGEILTFDSVVISIFANEGDEEPIQEPVAVPCNWHNHTISRLASGSYYVEIDAMTKYKDQELPFYQAKKEVSVPSKDEEEFSLLMGKGEIEIVWSFKNSLMCAANKVENIHINLTDETVYCTEGIYTITDMNWNTYDLHIEGLDEDDSVLFSGDANDIEVLPGQIYQTHIVLQ